MATEYTDGTIGESKPFTEALSEFLEACEAGTAKAFYVGSPADINIVRQKKALQVQVDELKERLDSIGAEKHRGVIEIPTPRESKRLLEMINKDPL